MTLSPAFLDELRARTQLSALIGRSVKLQRAGREHKACCPFHDEKTPSFTINDEKHFYHCFGCGAHGDAIRFLTDARGMGFMDAVRELADAAGLELPAPDPRSRERAERAAGLHDVMAAAERWFQEQLAGIDGAAARAYLDGRGVSAATRAAFGFGFAPDSRQRLKSALAQFPEAMLVEAGLLIRPDEGTPYDRFRGRLMIPIRDARGRTIAFGGRILGPGEPKYLNSPETPLFDKGRTLFNIDRAAAASRSAGRLVVVEGYMDVVALHEAGIGEAVAPLGTAVTEDQIERLWRLVDVPILCMDGDAAGRKAAVRAGHRALPLIAPGRSLAFAALPTGQDPDDLVRGGGRPALEEVLGAAQSLVDLVWTAERDAEPLTTPEQKAGLKRRLLDHAGTIRDPDVRDEYRGDLLARFSAHVRPPREPWRPPDRSRPGMRPAVQRGLSSAARSVGMGGLAPQTARAVLQGLMRFPDQIAAHAEAVAALPLAQGDLRRTRDALLEAALVHGALDQSALDPILADAGVASVTEMLRRQDGLAFSFNRRDADPERARRDLVLAIETLGARPGLDTALAAATARLKEAGDEAAFAEQQRLRAARDEADRQLAALIEGQAGQAG